MPSIALMAALSAGIAAQESVPSADYATSLRLPLTAQYARLSPLWALAYSQVPTLVEMPAPTEAPTVLEDANGDEVLETLSQYMPDGHFGPHGWNRLHDRTMADLSLDWGLAGIGPGVLTPQPPLGGHSGAGSPGGVGGRSANPAQAPVFFTIQPPPAGGGTPPPGGGGQPPGQVPEPSSVLMWGLAAAACWAIRRRVG